MSKSTEPLHPEIQAISTIFGLLKDLSPDAQSRVLDYVERMGDAIAASDVVVARAGATSIAEITAIGRASVLVPYPYATDDHQTGNARAVANAGGAIIVPDGELDTPRFAESVLSLVSDTVARGRMAEAAARLGHRDATQRVASVVLDSVGPRKETR